MRRVFRASGIAAAVVAVAAISGAFTFTPAAGSVHATGPTRGAMARWPTRIQPADLALPARASRVDASAATLDVTSHRWSGYAASGKGSRFRFVRATFFVPYLDCASTPGSVSADWLGLDGFDNNAVEGTGIIADCNGSKPAYQVWFDLYPKDDVYPRITVGAGQSIVASVHYSSATRKFTFSVTDTTNGHHFSRSLGCPAGSTCPRMSAEVITQAIVNSPTDREPLANFRAESFSGVAIADEAGHRSGLRSARWTTYKVTTVNFSGAIMDQPTALFRGATFGNYWMRSG